MTDLWSYLKNCNKPIALYGTGNGADKVIDKLNSSGTEICGIFASDGFKKGKIFRGFTVTSYGELFEQFPEMIIVMCFGSNRQEVTNSVKNLMKSHEVYVADVPVCENTVFDLNFARTNAEKLKTVYSLLGDKTSKKVFENIVLFKLTGKPDYLFEIETERSEVFSLLNLNDNETFLDLGAYNGDTVTEFIENTKDYNFITALEPDSRNHRKLLENTKAFKNITCVNGAVSNVCGSLKMSVQHGRGVSCDGKTKEIPCYTIDFLSQKEPPTFIKIDVEGSESDAIDGGEKTIIKFKPKMHVAVYHKSEDIFEIPLKVHSLCPSYKIFMRHHAYLPAWDTNIIII